MHLSIDYATLEVELAKLVLHFQKQVVHQEDMDLPNVLHLHRVDAINFRDHALWVLFEVLKVLWESVAKYDLFALVHRLD